jgi:hypothetical protein
VLWVFRFVTKGAAAWSVHAKLRVHADKAASAVVTTERLPLVVAQVCGVQAVCLSDMTFLASTAPAAAAIAVLRIV